MGSSNICWGLEMGAGSIKALKVEADGDGLKVLDFAVIPHQRALSTPEIDQNDAMRVALGTLVSQYDLSGAQLAISIPGHQSFARFATLPPVEPKKVPDIVKFEAVQQIPFALEEVEWDYQTFVSPDSPDIEVGIFAVTRQRIMEQLNMLQDVGLTPDLATLSPVAAYNAMASDLSFTEDTPGTVILDIGTVSSDLIIAEAGRVWVRTFPIGGHQFTEALVNQFKLSYSKAEKLKKESEQSKHARHALQAMRPVFSDVAQEIERSIGFYKSVHADADLKRLVGLGSTFRLPGLRKYLKQQLGLDVYRLEQFKKLGLEGPQAGEFQAASLNMATAYGCALQCLNRAPLKANLMPVPVLKTAMWKRKVPYLGVAAGMAAAAAGAMFVRPLLDSTAFQSAQKPPEISKVVGEASTLSQAAEEAGVLDSARGDKSAAEIVSLVSNRELYTNMLEDVASLRSIVRAGVSNLKQTDARMAEQIGDRESISLIALDTRYSSGVSEAAATTGRGSRNRNEPEPSASAVVSRIGQRPHVEMTAEFEIPVGEAYTEAFVFDVIAPAILDTLPTTRSDYAILVDDVNFWSGGASASTSSRGTRTTQTRVGSSRDSRTTSGSSRRGGGNLGSLAPLDRPEAGEETASSRITLRWYAVLVDPATLNNTEGEG